MYNFKSRLFKSKSENEKMLLQEKLIQTDIKLESI